MALVVTPGAANADAYGTLAAFKAYCDGMGLSYEGKLDPVLEGAIRRATVWLDGKYQHRWPGNRLNGRAQSRAWPRIDAYDVSEELIDSATIPPEVVSASFEAAWVVSANPTILTPTVVLGREKILTEVDGIKWRPVNMNMSASADINSFKPELMAVEQVLAPLISFRPTPWHGVS